MPLLLTLLVSAALCYVIGRFAPNLWVVLIVVVGLQLAGFVWVVETGGVFKSYSIVNCAIIACVTFLWFLVSAQLHLWVNSKDPASNPNNKGQENG